MKVSMTCWDHKGTSICVSHLGHVPTFASEIKFFFDKPILSTRLISHGCDSVGPKITCHTFVQGLVYSSLKCEFH